VLVDAAELVRAERAQTAAQIEDLTAEFDGIVASVAAESPDDEHESPAIFTSTPEIGGPTVPSLRCSNVLTEITGEVSVRP
jgi:hypothetical protein